MKEMTFEERFAQAVAIEPWDERMDALVMLIREDPTAYVEAVRELGTDPKLFFDGTLTREQKLYSVLPH